MKKVLKRLFLLLSTGAASLFLAACYGVPMMYGGAHPSTIKIKVTNASGAAIMGINVTADWLGATLVTDSEGYASLPTWKLGDGISYVSIQLIDTDGKDNGGNFGTQNVLLDAYDETTTINLGTAS